MLLMADQRTPLHYFGRNGPVPKSTSEKMLLPLHSRKWPSRSARIGCSRLQPGLTDAREHHAWTSSDEFVHVTVLG